jgi:hypothetical protein
VAITVWEEACHFMGEPLPRSWMLDLTRRTHEIATHNEEFRQRLNAPKNSGRDYLFAFMRHWISGLIIENYPHLPDRLPRGYQVGRAA